MAQNSLSNRIKNIKLIISDVDGVMTDGKILIGSNATESKFFNVEDGTGAALASYANIPIALISGRYSKATSIRAKELNVEYCFQGVLDKVNKLFELLDIYSVKLDQVAYIGDSLVDIPVLELVGLPITVPNAHDYAKKASLYITNKEGGEGVLFEVIEKILVEQNRYNKILDMMKEEKFK